MSRSAIEVSLVISVLLLSACGSHQVPTPSIVESLEPHRVQLLDAPALTLDRMLNTISHAEHDISLEYNDAFVCNWVGVVLFSAIQQRASQVARAGGKLRVRFLEDYSHYYNHVEGVGDAGIGQIIAIFRKHGIEHKVFNPLHGSYPINIPHLNVRDHQKRLIVDGREIVMGGRLLGNEYFGMAGDMDRMEADVWIQGPIVKSAQEYFDHLWENELSSDRFDSKTPLNPIEKREVSWTESCLSAQPLLPRDKLMIEAHARLESLARPEMEVRHLVMGFDYPSYAGKSSSFLPYFYGVLKTAEKSLLIEQQYFLPTASLDSVLHDLSSRGVKTEILTNSVASGDDPMIDWMTDEDALQYSKLPATQISLMTGKFSREHFGLWREGLEKVRWQIHAKAAVIDGQTSWIGSNNFDSRSERFNLETGVLIPDQPEFARILEQSIRGNLEGAVPVQAADPTLTHAPVATGLQDRIKILLYRALEVFL